MLRLSPSKHRTTIASLLFSLSLAGCSTLVDKPTPTDSADKENVESVNVDHEVLFKIPAKEVTVPLEDLRLFSEILDEIHKTYVDNVDDQRLIQDAIRGMLAGLDPHSRFYSADEFTEFNNDAGGKFTGIGVEIGVEEGEITVITPIDNSPAFKAGIQSGDIIRAINDNAVENFSIEDAVNLMRGEPGSEVTITVERKGETDFVNFNIVRETIRSNSVRSEWLNNRYLLIRISQFQPDTYRSLIEGYSDATASIQPEGIILDLRNNPGGLLQSAVDVSDAFLNSGDIVFTKSRGKFHQSGYSASESDISDGLPMIILINSGSASASEIVAGALQDNRRAIVLGTRSFGKGSVQSIRQLNDGKAIKLTTARYYTPNNRSIQARGIEPDIEIPQLKLGEDADKYYSYREENLDGHLSNEANVADEELHVSDNRADNSRLHDDFQLLQAVTILETLEFSKSTR